MENKYTELTQKYLMESDADAAAVAVLDFKTNTFEWFEIENHLVNVEKSKIYFDFASLTKPLTNSYLSIRHNLYNESQLKLLLNHRAGLPAWGLLSKNSWKEQLLSYNVLESETLYSDFSALRFMLEVESILKMSYQELLKSFMDSEVVFWKNLNGKKTVQNGFVKGKPNFSIVHDPNCYNLNVFTSHAGLFGTIEGLSKSLLRFAKDTDLLSIMQDRKTNDRYFAGFDTVQDTSRTLAGIGCSDKTFGHLGFTGTSFWIDPLKLKGVVILTNTTKYFWHHRYQLNPFRRDIGALVWK